MCEANIVKITLGGVFNPVLSLKIQKEECLAVEIYVDNKKCNLIENTEINRDYLLDLLSPSKNKNFDYHLTIPKFSRKAEVYIINQNNKILLKSININFCKRIFNKMLLILKKICRLPKIICKVIKICWTRHHFLFSLKLLKRYFSSFKKSLSNETIEEKFYNPLNQEDYKKWLIKNNKEIEHKNFSYNPLISIIVPVYNVKKEYLKECIDSVLNQTYKNYQICIADDNSTSEETKEVLKEYENYEQVKILYRKENGHISKCMNSALSLATGEYVGFLDNDDILSKEALYYMVQELNKEKYDLIYSDEDKLDFNGIVRDPHFKPDYSPDTLLSSNYICHFTIVKRKLMEEIGGFKSEYNGSQDYDLFLRISEKTNHISHVSKILYHWRMIEGSTASAGNNKSYAYVAGKKALEDYFVRNKINAKVHLIGTPQMYEIEYLYQKEPKVSIIIPTKDKAKVLNKCLKTIYEKTKYTNYEVIVIDNASKEIETKELLNSYKTKHSNFYYYTYNCEFNYSYLNNEAVKKSNGEYLIFLNNDIEIITSDWIKKMVGYASQKHIACVGAQLIYPNRTIQHNGVIIGLGGVAGHAFIGTGSENYGYFGRMVATYNYSAVTAACLMISKEKFNKVNGYDENLKVAYNDVDLNLKCLEKNYYNVLLPSIKLIHHESLSRGNDLSIDKKERFKFEIKYMAKKWDNKLKYDKYYNNNLSYNFPFLLEK